MRIFVNAKRNDGGRIREAGRVAVAASAAGQSLSCWRPIWHPGGPRVLDHLTQRGAAATPITPLTKAELKSWLAGQAASLAAWVTAADFTADPGRHLLVPDKGGGLAGVLLGVEAGADIWSYGGLPLALPPGTYRLAKAAAPAATAAALGWALGGYSFGRYKKPKR